MVTIVSFDVGKDTGIVVARVFYRNIVVLTTFVGFRVSMKRLLMLRNNIKGPIVFVVGLPITMCYKFSNKTKYIIDLCNVLRTTFKLPVVFQNEVLTSKLYSLWNRDVVSSWLILNRFLSRLNINVVVNNVHGRFDCF
ncbi:pre-16S rRNA-processing nuclease YqgF [Candidatus Hodgkinia cicadicola]|uniref:pre-16S rRNA-processing nuclease YqgF n=1 Tax=Candidatus Hodgkinia cicadicola TaxID=573658 RepID=UPI0011BA88A5